MGHSRDRCSRLAKFLAAAFVVAFLGGCASANWQSIYRTYSVDNSDTLTSILLDAKQRAIISQRRPGPVFDVKGKNPNIVCAEPSPDVFSAISQSFASSGAFSGTSKEAQLALSFALAESASELRRARTIQLLRDGLFTACLGYMNGALDEGEYQKLLNKYADATVTLLAIEQITPQEVSAPITLTAPTTDAQGTVSISNQAPADKGTKTPPDDAGKTPPADTGKTPPADTGKTPPADTGKTPPDDTGKTPPAGTGQTPPAGTQTPPQTPPAGTGKTPPAGTGKTPPAGAGETPPAGTGQTTPPKTGNGPSAEAKTGGGSTYPPGNAQSLAPPSDAAVASVERLVTSFLNDTLINKCIDTITDTRAAGGGGRIPFANPGLEADFAERANRAAEIRNGFCDAIFRSVFQGGNARTESRRTDATSPTATPPSPTSRPIVPR